MQQCNLPTLNRTPVEGSAMPPLHVVGAWGAKIPATESTIIQNLRLYKSTILGMQLVVNLRGLLLGCFVLNDRASAIARSLALSVKSKKIKSLQQGSCNILTLFQNTCHNQFGHLGTVSSLPALSQLYVVSGFLSQLSQDRPPEPVVYSLMWHVAWPGSLWLRVVKLGWLGSFLYIPLPEVE